MSTLKHPISKMLGFALATILVALPAAADDTEIYMSKASAGAQPNVLFIIDTSGSMDGKVDTTPLYVRAPRIRAAATRTESTKQYL